MNIPPPPVPAPAPAPSSTPSRYGNQHPSTRRPLNAGEGTEAESKEKHGVWEPHAEVNYNLTLGPLQSRLQHN